MAATAAMYSGTFHGRPDQVRRVRAAVARYLDGCPVADDVVLVVSEIASNSVLHSESGGEFFTVRCELHPDYVWVECEDLGGPWQSRKPDGPAHGLDVVEALASPDGWGTEETSGRRPRCRGPAGMVITGSLGGMTAGELDARRPGAGRLRPAVLRRRRGLFPLPAPRHPPGRRRLVNHARRVHPSVVFAAARL